MHRRERQKRGVAWVVAVSPFSQGLGTELFVSFAASLSTNFYEIEQAVAVVAAGLRGRQLCLALGSMVNLALHDLLQLGITLDEVDHEGVPFRRKCLMHGLALVL